MKSYICAKLTTMKKLFFALAIISTGLVVAQNKTKSYSLPVTFGIKGGLNISSLSNDGRVTNQKSKIGFNAGAFANIPITESFSIQPEVIFSQYGNKATYIISTVDNEYWNRSYTSNLGYIAVPVMLQYSFIPSLYVETGVELGFNIIAKEKFKETYSYGGLINITSGTENITREKINTINFGIGFGAGYYVTDNIGITARYVVGLTDIYNRPSGSDAIKNNVFQFGIVYRLKK